MLFIGLIALALNVSAAVIHEAARAGDLAKALVEKNPNLVRAEDNEGAMPLHHAVATGRREVAAYLIEKGAVVDQKDAMSRPPDGWSAPKFVGQGMFVSSSKDGQIYVTDQTKIPNGYLAKVKMVDGRFAGFERLRGGPDKLRPQFANIAHPAIASDGSYIVFDVGGGSHLYVFFRNPDGTGSEAVDLSRQGIDPRGGIASISPDGKYLFSE